MCVGCRFTGMKVKFGQESCTPWHSKRCRRQTAVVRNFLKKNVDARRDGLHFEQVWSRNVVRQKSYERGEDGWTDRQTAFQLYIVKTSSMMA